MKKLRTILSTLLLFATLGILTSWKIGENYSIKFSDSNGKVEGIFKELTGKIVFDKSELTSAQFDMSINVNSINTGNGTMNKHAKGKNWFDAEKYPTIVFTSSEVSKSDVGYVTTGTLQLHGISKKVSIPFTFENSTFTGKLTINRSDFGVGSLKGMSGKVSDDITIALSVPVTE